MLKLSHHARWRPLSSQSLSINHKSLRKPLSVFISPFQCYFNRIAFSTQCQQLQNSKPPLPTYFSNQSTQSNRPLPVYFPPLPQVDESPPSWSSRPRGVRWSLYASIFFFSFVCHRLWRNREEVPFIDRRRSVLSEGALEKLRDKIRAKDPYSPSSDPPHLYTWDAVIKGAAVLPIGHKDEQVRRAYQLFQELLAENELDEDSVELQIIDEPRAGNYNYCFPGRLVINRGFLDTHSVDSTLAAHFAFGIASEVLFHREEFIADSIHVVAIGLSALLLLPVTRAVKRSRKFTLPLIGLWVLQASANPLRKRDMEEESTELGLAFLARAGLDPRITVGYWEKETAFAKKFKTEQREARGTALSRSEANRISAWIKTTQRRQSYAVEVLVEDGYEEQYGKLSDDDEESGND